SPFMAAAASRSSSHSGTKATALSRFSRIYHTALSCQL
ncbi:uncharacterized protein METZ01_LOCUS214066, partial [marine metagenome]